MMLAVRRNNGVLAGFLAVVVSSSVAKSGSVPASSVFCYPTSDCSGSNGIERFDLDWAADCATIDGRCSGESELENCIEDLCEGNDDDGDEECGRMRDLCCLPGEGADDICVAKEDCIGPRRFCSRRGLEVCKGGRACCAPGTTLVAFNIQELCEGEYGGTLCTGDNTGGGCIGDPHFKTWAGKWYDYHGVCDLVLLSSTHFGNGLGLNLHIRTTGRSEFSFIETAALQIGDDILEVSSFGEYFLNGVEEAELPGLMADMYPITYHKHMAGDHVIDEKRHHFEVELSTNPYRSEKVVISTFKDIVSVKIENATPASFHDSVGLMGDFENGELLARDGKTVLHNDMNVFGQQWQVLESEPKLFQTVREPQHAHQSCILPALNKEESHRLGQATLSKKEAEAACAHWDESHRHTCIYDVVAMGDLELAHAHF